eukprot:3181938-Pyramimonas_sp.AAC.1
MHDSRFSQPLGRPGRLRRFPDPLGSNRPACPSDVAACFLLVASLLLISLVLNVDPFPLSLHSIRPRLPCFRGCAKYAWQ